MTYALSTIWYERQRFLPAVLAVSFRAVPKPSGSDISISSKVTTSYPGYEGTATQVPASDSDCVSNGTIEQQLTSVLR